VGHRLWGWPTALTDEQVRKGRYLLSLGAAEELAVFVESRGHCLLDNGRIREARMAYEHACRLDPLSPGHWSWLEDARVREASLVPDGGNLNTLSNWGCSMTISCLPIANSTLSAEPVRTFPLDSTRYRNYHPTLGRWIERDPATYADAMNLYAYAGDAPETFRDPSGLWWGVDHDYYTRQSLEQLYRRTDPQLRYLFNYEVTRGCKVWAEEKLVQANIGQDSTAATIPVTDGNGNVRMISPFDDLRRHYNKSSTTAPADADRDYLNYLEQERQVFNSELDKVRGEAASSTNQSACVNALEALGRMTHSWQDYYAHAVLQNGKAGPAWGAGIAGSPTALSPQLRASTLWEHGVTEPATRDTGKDARGNTGDTLRRIAATNFVESQYRQYLVHWFKKCKCFCPPKP